MKMSIHRALAELKLCDNKVGKLMSELQSIGVAVKGGLVDNKYPKEDFEKKAKAQMQSLVDLIERKKRIKMAIVLSNATTKVVVNGREMSVADAITEKDNVSVKRSIVMGLERQRLRALDVMEKHNATTEAKALKLAEAALSKDNVAIGDDDANAIISPFMERNKATLVDPLDTSALIASLSEENDNFMSEVDAVLSESNAVTVIEID